MKNKKLNEAAPALLECCIEQMKIDEKKYQGMVIPYHEERRITRLMDALFKAGITPEQLRAKGSEHADK